MDIDLLAKMVKEIILDKDEVYLPGIGSFIAEPMPATFSDKGYTINPPYRKLSFRQRNDSTDTSLIDLYSKSNKIERASAEKILIDFLKEMKELLQQKKIIIFPGLGRLRATKENNFFFVAEEELDIFPYGFALEPISLKFHKETEKEVSDAVENLKSIISIQEQSPAENEEHKPIEKEESKEELSIEELSREEEPKEELSIEAEPKTTLEATEKQLKEEEKVQEQVTKNECIAKKRSIYKKILLVLIYIAATAAFLLIIFIIVAYFFPEFTDKLLYSKEELEILYYK